jgi:hypothetical protein
MMKTLSCLLKNSFSDKSLIKFNGKGGNYSFLFVLASLPLKVYTLKKQLLSSDILITFYKLTLFGYLKVLLYTFYVKIKKLVIFLFWLGLKPYYQRVEVLNFWQIFCCTLISAVCSDFYISESFWAVNKNYPFILKWSNYGFHIVSKIGYLFWYGNVKIVKGFIMLNFKVKEVLLLAMSLRSFLSYFKISKELICRLFLVLSKKILTTNKVLLGFSLPASINTITHSFEQTDPATDDYISSGGVYSSLDYRLQDMQEISQLANFYPINWVDTADLAILSYQSLGISNLQALLHANPVFSQQLKDFIPLAYLQPGDFHKVTTNLFISPDLEQLFFSLLFKQFENYLVLQLEQDPLFLIKFEYFAKHDVTYLEKVCLHFFNYLNLIDFKSQIISQNSMEFIKVPSLTFWEKIDWYLYKKTNVNYDLETLGLIDAVSDIWLERILEVWAILVWSQTLVNPWLFPDAYTEISGGNMFLEEYPVYQTPMFLEAIYLPIIITFFIPAWFYYYWYSQSLFIDDQYPIYWKKFTTFQKQYFIENDLSDESFSEIDEEAGGDFQDTSDEDPQNNSTEDKSEDDADELSEIHRFEWLLIKEYTLRYIPWFWTWFWTEDAEVEYEDMVPLPGEYVPETYDIILRPFLELFFSENRIYRILNELSFIDLDDDGQNGHLLNEYHFLQYWYWLGYDDSKYLFIRTLWGIFDSFYLTQLDDALFIDYDDEEVDLINWNKRELWSKNLLISPDSSKYLPHFSELFYIYEVFWFSFFAMWTWPEEESNWTDFWDILVEEDQYYISDFLERTTPTGEEFFGNLLMFFTEAMDNESLLDEMSFSVSPLTSISEIEQDENEIYSFGAISTILPSHFGYDDETMEDTMDADSSSTAILELEETLQNIPGMLYTSYDSDDDLEDDEDIFFEMLLLSEEWLTWEGLFLSDVLDEDSGYNNINPFIVDDVYFNDDHPFFANVNLMANPDLGVYDEVLTVYSGTMLLRNLSNIWYFPDVSVSKILSDLINDRHDRFVTTIPTEKKPLSPAAGSTKIDLAFEQRLFYPYAIFDWTMDSYSHPWPEHHMYLPFYSSDHLINFFRSGFFINLESPLLRFSWLLKHWWLDFRTIKDDVNNEISDNFHLHIDSKGWGFIEGYAQNLLLNNEFGNKKFPELIDTSISQTYFYLLNKTMDFSKELINLTPQKRFFIDYNSKKNKDVNHFLLKPLYTPRLTFIQHWLIRLQAFWYPSPNYPAYHALYLNQQVDPMRYFNGVKLFAPYDYCTNRLIRKWIRKLNCFWLMDTNKVASNIEHLPFNFPETQSKYSVSPWLRYVSTHFQGFSSDDDFSIEDDDLLVFSEEKDLWYDDFLNGVQVLPEIELNQTGHTDLLSFLIRSDSVAGRGTRYRSPYTIVDRPLFQVTLDMLHMTYFRLVTSFLESQYDANFELFDELAFLERYAYPLYPPDDEKLAYHTILAQDSVFELDKYVQPGIWEDLVATSDDVDELGLLPNLSDLEAFQVPNIRGGEFEWFVPFVESGFFEFLNTENTGDSFLLSRPDDYPEEIQEEYFLALTAMEGPSFGHFNIFSDTFLFWRQHLLKWQLDHTKMRRLPSSYSTQLLLDPNVDPLGSDIELGESLPILEFWENIDHLEPDYPNTFWYQVRAKYLPREFGGRGLISYTTSLEFPESTPAHIVQYYDLVHRTVPNYFSLYNLNDTHLHQLDSAFDYYVWDWRLQASSIDNYLKRQNIQMLYGTLSNISSDLINSNSIKNIPQSYIPVYKKHLGKFYDGLVLWTQNVLIETNATFFESFIYDFLRNMISWFFFFHIFIELSFFTILNYLIHSITWVYYVQSRLKIVFRFIYESCRFWVILFFSYLDLYTFIYIKIKLFIRFCIEIISSVYHDIFEFFQTQKLVFFSYWAPIMSFFEYIKLILSPFPKLVFFFYSQVTNYLFTLDYWISIRYYFGVFYEYLVMKYDKFFNLKSIRKTVDFMYNLTQFCNDLKYFTLDFFYKVKQFFWLISIGVGEDPYVKWNEKVLSNEYTVNFNQIKNSNFLLIPNSPKLLFPELRDYLFDLELERTILFLKSLLPNFPLKNTFYELFIIIKSLYVSIIKNFNSSTSWTYYDIEGLSWQARRMQLTAIYNFECGDLVWVTQPRISSNLHVAKLYTFSEVLVRLKVYHTVLHKFSFLFDNYGVEVLGLKTIDVDDDSLTELVPPALTTQYEFPFTKKEAFTESYFNVVFYPQKQFYSQLKMFNPQFFAAQDMLNKSSIVYPGVHNWYYEGVFSTRPSCNAFIPLFRDIYIHYPENLLLKSDLTNGLSNSYNYWLQRFTLASQQNVDKIINLEIDQHLMLNVLKDPVQPTAFPTIYHYLYWLDIVNQRTELFSTFRKNVSNFFSTRKLLGRGLYLPEMYPYPTNLSHAATYYSEANVNELTDYLQLLTNEQYDFHPGYALTSSLNKSTPFMQEFKMNELMLDWPGNEATRGSQEFFQLMNIYNLLDQRDPLYIPSTFPLPDDKLIAKPAYTFFQYPFMENRQELFDNENLLRQFPAASRLSTEIIDHYDDVLPTFKPSGEIVDYEVLPLMADADINPVLPESYYEFWVDNAEEVLRLTPDSNVESIIDFETSESNYLEHYVEELPWFMEVNHFWEECVIYNDTVDEDYQGYWDDVVVQKHGWGGYNYADFAYDPIHKLNQQDEQEFLFEETIKNRLASAGKIHFESVDNVFPMFDDVSTDIEEEDMVLEFNAWSSFFFFDLEGYELNDDYEVLFHNPSNSFSYEEFAENEAVDTAFFLEDPAEIEFTSYSNLRLRHLVEDSMAIAYKTISVNPVLNQQFDSINILNLEFSANNYDNFGVMTELLLGYNFDQMFLSSQRNENPWSTHFHSILPGLALPQHFVPTRKQLMLPYNNFLDVDTYQLVYDYFIPANSRKEALYNLSKDVGNYYFFNKAFNFYHFPNSYWNSLDDDLVIYYKVKDWLRLKSSNFYERIILDKCIGLFFEIYDNTIYYSYLNGNFKTYNYPLILLGYFLINFVGILFPTWWLLFDILSVMPFDFITSPGTIGISRDKLYPNRIKDQIRELAYKYY